MRKPLDPQWTICPYCETEVPGAVQPRRSSRRRRREEEPPGEQETAVEPSEL